MAATLLHEFVHSLTGERGELATHAIQADFFLFTKDVLGQAGLNRDMAPRSGMDALRSWSPFGLTRQGRHESTLESMADAYRKGKLQDYVAPTYAHRAEALGAASPRGLESVLARYRRQGSPNPRAEKETRALLAILRLYERESKVSLDAPGLL